MPTSPNRRRIEIPAALFARLEERARRDGQTLAGLVAMLLSGALDTSSQPPIAERQTSDNSTVREMVQQVLSNDVLQLRELQSLQQRLDAVMRALLEGQLPAESDPGATISVSQATRQRLLDALTETYITAPRRPPSTLAQSGESRPTLSRTLWQRPKDSPEHEPSDKPEE